MFYWFGMVLPSCIRNDLINHEGCCLHYHGHHCVVQVISVCKRAPTCYCMISCLHQIVHLYPYRGVNTHIYVEVFTTNKCFTQYITRIMWYPLCYDDQHQWNMLHLCSHHTYSSIIQWNHSHMQRWLIWYSRAHWQ